MSFAERQVKTRLLLMGIVEAEKIEVSEEELEEELKMMSMQYNTSVDEIKNMLGAENLAMFKKDIQIKKAIQFIYDNANVK